MIRVALVDDQAIIRAGLARILSPADGFEIVAECADGRQAVEKLPALHPDVVLMDVRMPCPRRNRGNGALRGMEDPLRVLVLTTFGEDEVLWGRSRRVLPDSCSRTAARRTSSWRSARSPGGGLVRPCGRARVLDGYRRVVAPAARDAARLDLLTDREHDVLG